MRLRDSAEVQYGSVPAVRERAHQRAGKTGRQEGHKMISTMAQLKNCCLGGLKARTERGRTKIKSLFLNPLFPPSFYLNQLSLSRDIIYPIIFDQINIFTRIFH